MKIFEFDTIEKANEFLKTVSYSTLYDIKFGFVNGEARKFYITVYGGTLG